MFLLHPQIEPWLVRGATGCTLSLLVERSEGLEVLLRCEPDNEAQLIPMRYTGRVGQLHRFEAELPWDGGNDPTVYCFLVIERGRQRWLAGDGQHPRIPHRDQMFRINRADTPPTWVRDQVFYQIFPDRFCQGDPSLAVKGGEYRQGMRQRSVIAKRWGELPEAAQGGIEFYGGDLVGVQRQIDYLERELGITALYLNPVFTAGSNHKYDTEDYYHVDPHLGGNDALAALSAALRERGMRLLLDAVVNHTGTDHPWFNLHGTHDTLGAAQSPHSPWRRWYAFDDAGQYQGWKGHLHLPVLDYRAPGLRERVYAGPNAILRHWMRAPYRIDGWRFDVIHMLGEGSGSTNNAHYVREFRRAMREENPQSYVMGEHFSEATRWLQGDQEDGAMNYYGFAHPLREWLAGVDIAYLPAKLDTRDFSAWLDAARGRIPYDNQLAQFNLLDSHDTARFFTLVGADAAKMKLAVTLLFAYPGAPCIYYGDEIGLEGGQDPDCRRCFDWDRSHWYAELFEHYRASIALRRSRAEWRHGGYQALLADGDVFAFARFTTTAASVVVLNRGTRVTVRIPVWQIPVAVKAWRATGTEALAVEPGWVTIDAAPGTGVVLLGD
ncbi:maltodextrin glucosidase [Piscinibacter sp.]|uniref:maltodextrin glucosidase n=1 Tax=Piscinibacter sp. TaxID=1903157 RepID=UPI00355958FE